MAHRDASGWHPCLELAFAATGLTRRVQGIPIGKRTVGVTGHLSRDAVSAEITGRTGWFTCAVEPAIRADAAKLNGFELIVTHVADPAS